ncbi:MAG: hypothetical protein KAS66_15705 [Candidatus Omnitrophica bacterium]|nr:hypothetical protein [Candidatus Omnitrophota bacterium]
MVNQKLFDDVNKLGVPLMTPEEDVDVYKTLADVVKSHNMRLWESFPALLATASSKYQLDLQRAQNQLNRLVDQKAFNELLVLSKAMYDSYNVQFSAFNKAFESAKKVFEGYDRSLKPLRDALKQNQLVPVANVRLSTERLKSNFKDYLSYRNLEQKKQNAKHQELSLEHALSNVFSPKQKELLKKKLNGEKMTKTEREYYSRAVKKKVLALANSELYHLSRSLLM